MSAAQTLPCRLRYRTRELKWGLPMIPWYRQLLSLVYGLGIMMIGLYAIDQNSTAWLIGAVVFMSMGTLALVFGVEANHARLTLGDTFEFEVGFTNTGMDKSVTKRVDKDDDDK